MSRSSWGGGGGQRWAERKTEKGEGREGHRRGRKERREELEGDGGGGTYCIDPSSAFPSIPHWPAPLRQARVSAVAPSAGPACHPGRRTILVALYPGSPGSGFFENIPPSPGLPVQEAWAATSADRHMPALVLTVCVETAAAATLCFLSPPLLVGSGSLKNPCINSISGDSRAGLEKGLKILRIWGSGTWEGPPRFLVQGQMVNACEPQN